jgi:hypothetical protein
MESLDYRKSSCSSWELDSLMAGSGPTHRSGQEVGLRRGRGKEG